MCERMKKDAARQKYVFLWSSFVVYLSLSGILGLSSVCDKLHANPQLSVSCYTSKEISSLDAA